MSARLALYRIGYPSTPYMREDSFGGCFCDSPDSLFRQSAGRYQHPSAVLHIVDDVEQAEPGSRFTQIRLGGLFVQVAS
jgi:hypothetical protein